MSLLTLLKTWRGDPGIGPNIVEWRTLPARDARFVPFPDGIHPALVAALRAGAISALYSHQLSAWQQVQAGCHPVVVTGTASGKTLCYNLPVLDRLLSDPSARALYLFPIKALAQDQKAELDQLVTALEPETGAPSHRSGQKAIPVATYDGDTPAAGRPAIRGRARVVISNPDMVHAGILPHHTAWADFFSGLRFVVIDEMHTYRGVFGSHVANVLRRLKRVARFYGSAPQFILTSATIGNPLELAGRLIEEPVVLVDDDGAANAARHFLIYNPPIVNRELGLRRGLLQESVRLAQDLGRHDIQTIVFGRTRRTVELMVAYLQRETPERPDEQVRAYRSGYLPHQRRQIERGLRQGDVRTVVATSALELGIDIGGMGAAVLAGYPGTVAQTIQQAGRAGRQHEQSLAVLITSASPLDQFLARHPDYFFGRSPEHALINPDHLLIFLEHVRCAAFELPFEEGERFGTVEAVRLEEYLAFLQRAGDLHRSGHKYFWMADGYPAQDVSLRSASAETVVLQHITDEEEPAPVVIGQVDRPSAAWMVHPQAIYLHQGQSYVVEDLDLAGNVARLHPVDTNYYTEPRTHTEVQLVEKTDEAAVLGATKSHGNILVTTQVVGFRRIQWFTHQHLGEGEVCLPPDELPTTGYWVALTGETVEALRAQGTWTNDPNDYGPDWAAQRNRARDRDGHRCQICGTPERGRAHDVHHKTPFRALESYREANRLSNLATLCPTCHQQAESNVRMRSGLAGLAFAMGQLAPLSLMCDVRDVEVHADPQSPLSEGRPTVLIYDGIPAGIGFSQRLFEMHDALMGRVHELVVGCECADGCPSCVGPAGENGLGSKRETRAILELLCGCDRAIER